jgi:hypothetical protein
VNKLLHWAMKPRPLDGVAFVSYACHGARHVTPLQSSIYSYGRSDPRCRVLPEKAGSSIEALQRTLRLGSRDLPWSAYPKDAAFRRAHAFAILSIPLLAAFALRFFDLSVKG